jgi:cytochrome c-type biogenesis protein CcmE
LAAALTAAVLLASALIYTSFSAANPVRTPSQLIAGARAGEAYQLTGVVVPGSIHRFGRALYFSVADRAGGHARVAVSYTGSVPDAFRPGREIIVDVRKHGSSYIGESGSLITKCPSKYAAARSGSQKY